MAQRQKYDEQFLESEVAHNLISKIDTTKDRDSNLAILLGAGIKKDPLKNALAYLKTSFVDTYPDQTEILATNKYNLTKDDILNQIIDFVYSTYPTLCVKCDSDYLPFKQDNSPDSDVQCFLCKTPAHVTCYKSGDIKLDNGIVFICQSCIQNVGKKKVEEKVTEKVDDSGTKVNTTIHTADGSHTSSDESTDNDEKKYEWIEKKKKVRKSKT